MNQSEYKKTQRQIKENYKTNQTKKKNSSEWSNNENGHRNGELSQRRTQEELRWKAAKRAE